MPLNGNLATMGFTDLIQWVAVSRKTGILVIKGPRCTKRILFHGGLVAAVASDDPAEHLGTFLVGWGYLTEAGLQELLGQQRRMGTMLGEALVRRGVLSRDELRRVLVVKTEESVFDLMGWREGEFFFLEEAQSRRDFQGLDLAVDHFLMEGARQEDERRRIAELIPDSSFVPALARRPDPLPEPGDERRVLEAIDGVRSVHEVALACRMPEFQTLEIIFRAIRDGRVAVGPPRAHRAAAPARPAGRTAVQEATNSLALGELREAHRHLRRAAGDIGADTATVEEARSLEAEIAAELERTFVEGSPVPELAVSLAELDELETGPEDAFVLSRVDGRCTAQQVLSLLPGERSDNLLLLHDLLLRGLIRLRR